MSHDRKILQEVWDTGNFFNPEVLKICKVSRKDLDILTLNDRVSQAALASYQHITGVELDKHTLEYHGRLSRADGIAGPATLETVEAKRVSIHARVSGRRWIGLAQVASNMFQSTPA